MTIYDSELAAASRTPQVLVSLRIISCENWYAQLVQADSYASDDFSHASLWARFGCTVTDDSHEAPDGSMTADRLDFAAVGDLIRNMSSSFTAAGNAFTASVWLRSLTGTGTITLSLDNGSGTEVASTQASLTTSWRRFRLHKLFSISATGGVRFKISRETGDLSSVVAWRANCTQNPAGADRVILFPSVKTSGSTVNASKCAAPDAGNGSRCWYSRPTCQDVLNFNDGASWEDAETDGLKIFRFCLKSAPLPFSDGTEVWPLIRSIDFTPQEIDPEHAVTVAERVKIVFEDDAATWVWNEDKASAGALANTTAPSGTFWRRFMRIYRNYGNPRNSVTVLVGFVAPGMTESLYQQRGKYLIDNMAINEDGSCTMELVSQLRLLRTKAPAKISETNLLNGGITAGATSIAVDDSTELTPPGSGYTVTIQIDNEFLNVTAISGNTLTVERGRWGSTAASHADNAPWKEVLMFGTEQTIPGNPVLGKNPIDIVVELLRRAGIAAADIDTATLNDERDTWLSSSIDATNGIESGITFKRAGATIDSGNGGISVQQEVEKLIQQIREVCMLNLWVGEDQKITGRVFAPARPSVTLAELSDSDHLLKDSVKVDDNEESRISRVIVAYDLAAGKKGDNIADYQKVVAIVGADEEASAFYGTPPRTKTILSPWIRATDSSTPTKLARHILGRFRNPARKISFGLEIKDDAIKTGDFVNLTTARIQKPDGSTDGQRIVEIQKKQRAEARLSMESQDTGLIRRYGFIAPAGSPDYNAATATQRRYAFIGTAATNRIGAAKDEGYFIW